MVAEPHDGRDGGFTLMEMIVVVLLVGVLSSVMVAVVAVIIRNAPSTEASADDSRSYQRLVTWLPRDVASTPAAGFDFGGGSMCTGAAGVSLVHLTWSPNDGQTTTYAADYRLGPSGNGSQVMRYTCSGTTGADPYSGADVIEVTSVVRTAQATPSASGFGVTMRLTTCGDSECTIDGPLITVEAGSRNPSGALP